MEGPHNSVLHRKRPETNSFPSHRIEPCSVVIDVTSFDDDDIDVTSCCRLEPKPYDDDVIDATSFSALELQWTHLQLISAASAHVFLLIVLLLKNDDWGAIANESAVVETKQNP